MVRICLLNHHLPRLPSPPSLLSPRLPSPPSLLSPRLPSPPSLLSPRLPSPPSLLSPRLPSPPPSLLSPRLPSPPSLLSPRLPSPPSLLSPRLPSPPSLLSPLITARKALDSLDENQVNLKKWVEPFLEAGNADAIKDPRLDAPSDVVLKLARFALSCTATPVATRPSMARILSDLIAMKGEFLGADVDPVLVNIDSDLADRKGSNFSQEIRRAQEVASEREGVSGLSIGMVSIGEMDSSDSGV
ncbi:unnamed protein product [Closterium sp. NIES-65]|nr:unnamed protein product [Closterium sp. NIES-65]